MTKKTREQIAARPHNKKPPTLHEPPLRYGTKPPTEKSKSGDLAWLDVKGRLHMLVGDNRGGWRDVGDSGLAASQRAAAMCAAAICAPPDATPEELQAMMATAAALTIPMFTRSGKQVLEIRKFDAVTGQCACLVEGGALRTLKYTSLAHHFGDPGKRAHLKAAALRMSTQSTTQHEYAFETTLTAAIRVKAATEEEARAMLRAELDSANSNLGAWPSGEPILCEVSLFLIKGPPYEIDGREAVPTGWKKCKTCGGDGSHPRQEDQDCEDCGGSGDVPTGYQGDHGA